MTNDWSDWGTVAGSWDAHADDIETMKVPVTEALLRAVSLQPGDRVLELGAGPGQLSLQLSTLVGDGGSVLVTDVAAGMVEAAERRTADLANVTTAVVDASSTGLPDASFDAIVFRMGLMFTPDPAIALAEARRVLAPGGRAGFAVWAGLELNPWLTGMGMAAMMHGVVTGGPPVGPGEVFSLSDPDRLRTLLDGAGFTDVAVEEVDITHRSAGAADYIAAVGSLAPPIADALAAATPEAREKVHATAGELVAKFATGDGLAIPGRAIVATGRT